MQFCYWKYTCETYCLRTQYTYRVAVLSVKLTWWRMSCLHSDMGEKREILGVSRRITWLCAWTRCLDSACCFAKTIRTNQRNTRIIWLQSWRFRRTGEHLVLCFNTYVCIWLHCKCCNCLNSISAQRLEWLMTLINIDKSTVFENEVSNAFVRKRLNDKQNTLCRDMHKN